MNITPRALGFGEILDGGFTLYRRNFVALFGIALVPQVPVILYWIGIMGFMTAEVWDIAGILVLPWSIFATFLTLGALSHAAARAAEGHDPGVKGPLVAGLRTWFPVAIAGVLAWFAVVLGLIFFILPGLFLLAAFFAFAPVIAVEGGGPIRALGRSWALTRGGKLRVLGVTIIAYLIMLIPMAAIGTIGLFLAVGTAGFATGDPAATEGAALWVTGMFQILGPIISAITWPFFVAVLVLLYFDRRARTEAPDLEAAVGRLEASG